MYNENYRVPVLGTISGVIVTLCAIMFGLIITI